MQWNHKNYASLHEAVNGKSGGRADSFIAYDTKQYHIQNASIMASWLTFYAKNNYPITIIGDYDVDGVHATAEMFIALTAVGAKNVTMRLPKRMSEGFGLSENIVDEVKSGVLVTVDNGIAAIKAVKKAKAKNLIVLIIDHHMPVVEKGELLLPEADLIVDPWVDDGTISKGTAYDVHTDFKGYCGAGLVYKIAQMMIPGSMELDKISALAAIASIADVMPLIDDNRNIYKHGMSSIQKGHITQGTQALVDLLQSGNMVTEDEIGFRIAPMVNAPGRIYDDGAHRSLMAVLSGNYSQAKVLIDELKSINEMRKDLKKAANNRADDFISNNCLFGCNPIVVVDEETPEGIVGLTAGYIQEKYNVSAIVFTKKDGYYKGSARAGEGDNLKLSLDTLNNQHPEVFRSYGGHAGAAGVSVYTDKIDLFVDEISKIMQPARPVPDYIEYDLEIKATEVSSYAQELQKYVPFGEGNPPIIFRINEFKVLPYNNSHYTVLKDNSIKLLGPGCTALGFGKLDQYIRMNYPTTIDIVGKISYHYFMGKASPQIEIIDFKPSVCNIQRTSLQAAIAQTLKLNNL